MIYLVRHGHAGNKRTWNGPDSQRPLSPTGRRESVGPIVRLRAEPIGRILSSPALRCQQTVQPLAEQCRLAVELDQRLAVEAGLEQVTGMVFNPALGDAALCTHEELIGSCSGCFVSAAPIGPAASGRLAWRGPCWRLGVGFPPWTGCLGRMIMAGR